MGIAIFKHPWIGFVSWWYHHVPCLQQEKDQWPAEQTVTCWLRATSNLSLCHLPWKILLSSAVHSHYITLNHIISYCIPWLLGIFPLKHHSIRIKTPLDPHHIVTIHGPWRPIGTRPQHGGAELLLSRFWMFLPSAKITMENHHLK